MTLTVHHLHCSSSERIPWICEELGIPYELKTYKRTPTMIAPPEYKALHPTGTAPVIQDGDLTLAESAACLEYICNIHGAGRFLVKPGDPGYPEFLFWFHWVHGSFQPALLMPLGGKILGVDMTTLPLKMAFRIDRALGMLEKQLTENEWLAGSEFTVADVMLVFNLTTFRYSMGYELGKYEGILAYLERIAGREAYQRAMAKSDPRLNLALGAEVPKEAYQVSE